MYVPGGGGGGGKFGKFKIDPTLVFGIRFGTIVLGGLESLPDLVMEDDKTFSSIPLSSSSNPSSFTSTSTIVLSSTMSLSKACA